MAPRFNTLKEIIHIAVTDLTVTTSEGGMTANQFIQAFGLEGHLGQEGILNLGSLHKRVGNILSELFSEDDSKYSRENVRLYPIEERFEQAFQQGIFARLDS